MDETDAVPEPPTIKLPSQEVVLSNDEAPSQLLKDQCMYNQGQQLYKGSH
jgi:hypothetical protein